jgi:hypothetical protein
MGCHDAKVRKSNHMLKESEKPDQELLLQYNCDMPIVRNGVSHNEKETEH